MYIIVMSLVNTVVIPSAVFVALDFGYWFISKNFLNGVFEKSESVYSAGNMKNVGFIINMLIQLFALVYFLILGFSTILNAFIFGLVLQGYTSSINYAIVKDWNVGHGVLCTLWKGVLFALTVYISRML